MNFHSKEWIMEKVKEHYDEAVSMYGTQRIVGVFYQGSGNYGLDYEGSDVDTKCIIVPTLEELASGSQPISHTHVRYNDEHIDFKDVRIMCQVFEKHNINYIEILYTDYYIINPLYATEWNEFIKHRDTIVESDPIELMKSLFGVASEKFHALEHRYPSRLEWLDKFGYDPKQLHHLLRLKTFSDRYKDGETFQQCLTDPTAELSIKVKTGLYNLDEAREIATSAMKDITDNRTALTAQNLVPTDTVKKLSSKFLEELKITVIKKGVILSLTIE